jgi:PAN domain
LEMFVQQLKRLLMVLLVGVGLLVSAGLLARSPALAQDNQMMRDKVIQGGDYDKFQLAGPGGARSCAETCNHDPRCQAWTYVRADNQCRLKYEARQMADDPCCISGVKPGAAADRGGKQDFCSDFARKAVADAGQNTSQECHLQGGRWSEDFQVQFSYCMGVRRDDANTEANARAADLVQCQQTANASRDAKCDHYARISMVQIDSAKKANCVLPQGDTRWGDSAQDRKQACLQAPRRALDHDIADREAVLAACFAAAGEARQACRAYVDKSLDQVKAATAQGCDVSGPDWSSSRDQHLQWCMGADANTRLTLIGQRDDQIAQCARLAAKRQACDQYADAAVGQAVRAETERCDLHGPNWSRYKDDHVAFCMQARQYQVSAASDDREEALKQCHQRAQVDPDCDEFAKRAVRLGQVNRDKRCGLDGDSWGGDYAGSYQFCLRSNPVQRRQRLDGQRAALFICSFTHGFKLDLGF